MLGITELGLVEMTRKKVRRKLSSLVQRSCPYCGGSGLVNSEETTAMNVRRLILRNVEHTDMKDFLVEVNPSVARYIEKRNEEGTPIIPKMEGYTFYYMASESAHLADYKVVELSSSKERDKLIGKAKVFC